MDYCESIWEVIMEKLMTIGEVQEACNVSRSTVVRWIHSGVLKASQPSGDWRIKPSDLEAMLESRSNVRESG